MIAVLRLLLVLGLLTACTSSNQPDVPTQLVPNKTSIDVTLPKPEQLPSLKEQALAGSQHAALQLALWYMKFPIGNDSQIFWTQIAAENGSAVGQFNFGLLLLEDESDPLIRVRARYWLTRSAAQGSELARAQLEQLDAARDP